LASSKSDWERDSISDSREAFCWVREASFEARERRWVRSEARVCRREMSSAVVGRGWLLWIAVVEEEEGKVDVEGEGRGEVLEEEKEVVAEEDIPRPRPRLGVEELNWDMEEPGGLLGRGEKPEGC
jgi:hypothetical protein